MDIKVFADVLRSKQKEIETYAKDTFPKKAQKMAVDHYKENFIKGGFVNDGLHKWDDPKRKKTPTKYANSQYKTLLSGGNNLYKSIRGRAEEGKAIIGTDREYAAIHNFGFRGTQHVKPHKRNRTVGLMSLKERKELRTGGQNVKGHSRQMNMPQRQFIGHSKELDEKLRATAVRDLSAILK